MSSGFIWSFYFLPRSKKWFHLILDSASLKSPVLIIGCLGGFLDGVPGACLPINPCHEALFSLTSPQALIPLSHTHAFLPSPSSRKPTCSQLASSPSSSFWSLLASSLAPNPSTPLIWPSVPPKSLLVVDVVRLMLHCSNFCSFIHLHL